MAELTTFDPVKLAEPKVQTIHVEGVGDVKYAPLNLKDYLELKEMPNESEKDAYALGLDMTFRMMVKAYPEMTKEHMMAWPHEQLTAITEALLDLPDFREKKSASGCGSPTRPKRSGRSAGSSSSSPPPC